MNTEAGFLPTLVTALSVQSFSCFWPCGLTVAHTCESLCCGVVRTVKGEAEGEVLVLSVLQVMEVVSVTEVRQELERGVGASVEPLVSRV